MVKRSAPEIIAFHFSSDISEVRDMRYQPTRYASPAVYCWGEDYYCCPTARQKPPKDPDFEDTFEWKELATYYGRTIFFSKAGREV